MDDYFLVYIRLITHVNLFNLFRTANMDRSNLYLKLFKLVFGSVSLFASDNEQMLKVRGSVTVSKLRMYRSFYKFHQF